MSSKKSSFILSIDLELAWGVQDKLNSSTLKRIIDKERLICKNLLNIFEEKEIPVTWAVVSALLDNKNKMINDQNQKAWYAPDILDNIFKSKINHLIASHSYSHKEFNKCSKEEIIIDFEQSTSIFKSNNINADVFVFPRNQVFHLDILKNFKFKTYRSVDKSWYKKIYDYNRFLGKVSNIIDKTIPIKTNSVVSSIDKLGLIEIPTSILFISKNGIRNIISNYSMFKKVKDGIDLAISRNECFHIWFHPSNFYFKTDSQFNLLKKIIDYVNLKREQGLMEIKLLDQFE